MPIIENDKKETIIFNFNKKHLENSNIPMWIAKFKGETYYLNHLDVSPNVGFSTKETPENPHTKGSLKFKGNFSVITENGLIIGKIN